MDTLNSFSWQPLAWRDFETVLRSEDPKSGEHWRRDRLEAQPEVQGTTESVVSVKLHVIGHNC